MKVFVTGVCGQLGHDVMNELARRGHGGTGSGLAPVYSIAPNVGTVCPMSYERLDITDEAAVRERLLRVRPDAVIHCAAWTAVDAAEEDGNREKVWAINVEGTRYIARVCRELGCKLMYISTDYVFDGQGEIPWKPDDETFAPLNVYGRTKLEGERVVREQVEKFFIVRTAWAFGQSGNNFIKTILRLGQTQSTLRVVDDQIGTPTYTLDLARLLVDMIETEKYGIYHATNEGGYISWYDFACEIFRQAGLPVTVQPVTTAEYGQSAAVRPFNSRLDKTKLVTSGFVPLPDWRDALGRYLREIQRK